VAAADAGLWKLNGTKGVVEVLKGKPEVIWRQWYRFEVKRIDSFLITKLEITNSDGCRVRGSD
jgi:hypothetical protein